MQLLKAVAAISAALVIQGCSSVKTTERASSPDGRYVAWVEVSEGIGGATGGYLTDVAIQYKSGWSYLGKGVLTVRSAVKTRLQWRDARHLEINVYPWDREHNTVLHFLPRWRDINVSYTMEPASRENMLREPIP